MIRKKLLEDERKVKVRNPKKQLVSEEKWSEEKNWLVEIVREGEEREKESPIEEEGKPQPEVINVDKAMMLMVPGTRPIKPSVQPLPPPVGFIKKSYGPREGGEIFAVLLETATKIFNLVFKAGRNIVSMATPIIVLVEKGACRMDKIQALGF